jgi:hypothetical protein
MGKIVVFLMVDNGKIMEIQLETKPDSLRVMVIRVDGCEILHQAG